MKKKIIKLLLKILFTKEELNKIEININNIYIYLSKLEKCWYNDKICNVLCLDIAILRKWLLHKVLIYFINKNEIKAKIKIIDKTIITHIDNNRYTALERPFVDKYKQNIVKLDDIIE